MENKVREIITQRLTEVHRLGINKMPLSSAHIDFTLQALLTAVLGCEPEKLPIDPLGIPGRGSGMENDNAWGWNNNGNEYTKNIRKLFGEE